jgi:hypothetical protein
MEETGTGISQVYALGEGNLLNRCVLPLQLVNDYAVQWLERYAVTAGLRRIDRV